jgi:hypothetical protein
MSWRWAPLAARCRRETKDRRNGWRAEPATSPKIRTRFRPPILMARPVSPLIRGRTNRGNCRLAGSRLIVDDNDAGCSAWKLMLSRDGRRWPTKLSLNDKAVDAPALIVGERSVLVPLSGRDVSAARPSRSELPAPHPFGLVCREAPATNADLRLKAAGMEPTNALTGLDHAGLRPPLCCPWRILRRRLKDLTGVARTRYAGCGRRREGVVAKPRRAFVGLTPSAGTERARRRALAAD